MLMSHHLHTLDAHVPSPTLDGSCLITYTRCSCPITYTRCSCPILHTLDAHIPSPTLDAHVPSHTLDAHVPSPTLDAHVKDTFMMTMKEVKSYRMHYSNSTPKEMSHSFMLQGKHLHTTKLRLWHKILGELV